MKRAGPLILGAAAYLAVGVAAWWNVWTGGAGHTLTTSGWGDPAQQIWFLEWVPHALGSGLDPFVSHAMFAPGGINLMANSSILFPALVASPLTVAFGPVVSFNVLVVLAPAASAFVAWIVFRRYAPFAFGSWLAGLFYGFSPFVLNDLADGHLHVTTLVFPPLVWWLLDDLVVSRRRSALSRGVLLGAVLAAQALTSLEVLAMVVIVSAAGIVVLAARHPSEIALRWRRVTAGLAAAALAAGVLLAWPLEVLFAGPRRYSGSVFTSPESYVAWLKALVWPRGSSPFDMWAAYIGIPIVAIVLLGALRLRNGVLRLAVVLALIALVLAMGRSLHLTPKLGTGIPLPDRLFTNAPLLENLLPVRFMILVDFFVALGLAVVLQAVRDALGKLAATTRPALAPLTAGALGVVALLAPALAVPFPYPTRHVQVPAVYRSSALTTLPAGSILLGYPVMNGFEADPLIWQAAEHFPYDMVAGYGFVPSGAAHPIGSLPKSPVTTLFGDAQIGLLGPTISPSRAEAVRREIESWKVSDVVVLDTGRRPGRLASVLASVLGRSPTRVDGAWCFLNLRPPALDR